MEVSNFLKVSSRCRITCLKYCSCLANISAKLSPAVEAEPRFFDDVNGAGCEAEAGIDRAGVACTVVGVANVFAADGYLEEDMKAEAADLAAGVAPGVPADDGNAMYFPASESGRT